MFDRFIRDFISVFYCRLARAVDQIIWIGDAALRGDSSWFHALLIEVLILSS